MAPTSLAVAGQVSDPVARPAAVFKIASVTFPSVVLTCTVGDLLVKQSQDHPVHIPRLRVQTMRGDPLLAKRRIYLC
jgi:hypothetical protein